MTPIPEQSSRVARTRKYLPWAIFAAALVVYIATLNRWISFTSLPYATRVMGLAWGPSLHEPLFWLVTSPFQLLPVAARPYSLNLFSALCGALALGFLGRSVLLLPHDRTQEQRDKERAEFGLLGVRLAWVPAVFAVMACGFQLTFWENATVASGEMFNLMLFAFIIRCILEYRVDERATWLLRAALVYGLAIPNNWAMISYLPLFLVALIWVRGLAFFNVQFLLRMFLAGSVGLLLYLLLPIVQSHSHLASVPFWTALKANLKDQETYLQVFFNRYRLFSSDRPLWILILPSLLPILLMAIRWPSYFGDTSPLGVAIASFTFHLVHFVLLLLCIWVALDPGMSPRFHIEEPLRPYLPMLTFYYLGALSIGYFTGYFLLVFGEAPARGQRNVQFFQYLNMGVRLLLLILVVMAPILLVLRNLPQVKLANGRMYSDLAASLVKGLPKDSVVLSDDWRRIALAQIHAGRDRKNFIFLDTDALKWPDYQGHLKKQYGEQWPFKVPADKKALTKDFELMDMVRQLSATHPLYYLHPSFGYYFEMFYPVPRGMVYELARCPTNSLLNPPVSDAVVAENESFWSGARSGALKPLLDTRSTNGHLIFRAVQGLEEKLRLPRAAEANAAAVGALYSRSLDFWGVQLQRRGELQKAAAALQLAKDLKEDNIAATVTLAFNQNLQAGKRQGAALGRSVEDQFDKYRDWEQVLNINGPFDEPAVCFEQGKLFVKNTLNRQAAQEFYRAAQLIPESLTARLLLAQLSVQQNFPTEALDWVKKIKSDPLLERGTETNLETVLNVEAASYFLLHKPEEAKRAVDDALERDPTNPLLRTTAVQLYFNFGVFSNAIPILDHELSLSPTNSEALAKKGYALMQMTNYNEALPLFSKVLETQTNNHMVRLDRAIGYLKLDKLDEARGDYEKLQKVFPTAYQVYYGLGEVAYRKHETNEAIRNYEMYLGNAPTNSERKTIAERVEEMKHPH
jgi:tetratricopeptide (TPR) repeat protein